MFVALEPLFRNTKRKQRVVSQIFAFGFFKRVSNTNDLQLLPDWDLKFKHTDTEDALYLREYAITKVDIYAIQEIPEIPEKPEEICEFICKSRTTCKYDMHLQKNPESMILKV